MHRNARRTARDLKRATPVYVTGAEARFAANDSGDSYCLRCGHEGHTADECTQKLPACSGVTACAECRVCGGPRRPGESDLCSACRGLAATFARASELRP